MGGGGGGVEEVRWREREGKEKGRERVLSRKRVEVVMSVVGHVGMGDISILLYIMILRAHIRHIVVVLQLSSYHFHIISSTFFINQAYKYFAS